ncbi:hypothetical protein MSG28_009604 [Choristoneura fumiferana]|uniref:Uncharacterized protein n=1 Tax=Choristoneura fumiferana TaxID=7141 RepID=A0ACC0JBR0_CHOFU|nr:hypothetical protein MSG28_009604 [Choristoneura fumiferana]
MDNLCIPTCAMHRQTGTVIVKTENSDCRRTLDNSRYVNVCAAVCLLLLVGGLSPQSSAAPHRRAKMERHRRATQENNLWGNPCDYAGGSQVLYDDPDFDKVVSRYEGLPWLHSDKFKSFMAEEVLPKDKIKFEQTISPEFLNNVVSNIDSHLPSMQKALKMLVASLYAVIENGLNTNYVADVKLQNNLNITMNSVRQVLCVFNEVMDTRNVESIPLLDSEVPNVRAGDRVVNAILIYRDTLLYLDYLSQLMDVWGNQG